MRATNGMAEQAAAAKPQLSRKAIRVAVIDVQKISNVEHATLERSRIRSLKASYINLNDFAPHIFLCRQFLRTFCLAV